MSTAKTILGIVPGLQATSILGNNLRLMRKPTPKNMIKTATMNFMGIGLIRPTAQFINALD